MNLRNKLAGLAMVATIEANDDKILQTCLELKCSTEIAIAILAYKQADAMLKVMSELRTEEPKKLEVAISGKPEPPPNRFLKEGEQPKPPRT